MSLIAEIFGFQLKSPDRDGPGFRLSGTPKGVCNVTFEEVKQTGNAIGRHWARTEATNESRASIARNRENIVMDKPGSPHNLAIRMFYILNPDPDLYSELQSPGEAAGPANSFWSQFTRELDEKWFSAFALGFTLGALDVCDQDRA